MNKAGRTMGWRRVFQLAVFAACAPLFAQAPAAPTPAPDAGLPSRDIPALLEDQVSPTGINRLVTEPDIKVTHEFEANSSYVFEAPTRLYDDKLGNVSESHSFFQYVLSPEISKYIIPRVGAAWQNFAFGHSAALPIPNTVQSAAMVFGFDATLAEDWLLRFEAQPGVYSDFRDVSGRDVNVPFIVGTSWLIDQDLQVFGGLSVDLFRQYPVLPGVGFRWHFDEDWTLMFILPEPKVIYDIEKDIQIYAGANLLGTSVRVSDSFGSANGRSDLDNAIMSLMEVRVGAGASWRIDPALLVSLEGGYMVYREYDFHRANFRLRSDPAPYCQLSLKGAF